jgi:hypothetical protein
MQCPAGAVKLNIGASFSLPTPLIMKPYLTLLLLLAAFQAEAQQVILLQADSVALRLDSVDISDPSEEFALYVFFENTTQDTLHLHWKREIAPHCPAAWDIFPVDPNISYSREVNQSLIPISLAPADSQAFVGQLFFPKTEAGCCDVRLTFFQEGTPNQAVDTAYFHVEINANGGCIQTHLSDEAVKGVRLYPNPVSRFLYLDAERPLQQVEILNLRGEVLLQASPLPHQAVDVSDLPAGLYFCKIIEKNGHLSLQKLIKH